MVLKLFLTFALAFEQSGIWRDGRVVDYSGLENRRAERHRGFESLSLRKKAATFWLLLFSYYIIIMQLCLFFLWFFFNLVEKQRLQKKFPFKQFQTVPAIHVPFDLSTK